MKYLIANWKAHKTLPEVIEWWNIFKENVSRTPNCLQTTTVIIAPPLPFLVVLKDQIQQSGLPNMYLAAQDVSRFIVGSYTGEVPAALLQGLAQYAIINHSERHTHMNEDDTIGFEKARLAEQVQLEPIFCITDAQKPVPEFARFVAYEPTSAIGSGMNAPADEVKRVRNALPSSVVNFIYGGSVNPQDLHEYDSAQVNGFLVGQASLNPDEFYSLLLEMSKQP